MFFDKSIAYVQYLRGLLALSAATAAFCVAVAYSFPAPAQGVQRIAAVVNEDVISAYELNQRVQMVMITGRVPDTAENRRKLSNQILRNMIDEQLQLQEAKRLNIRISDEEIDKLLVGLNAQNQLPAGSLEKMLARANVDINVLKVKLRAEESWGKVLRNRLQQQVIVSDEDVDDELKRLKATQHLPRHRVAEIFLPIDNPDNEKQVFEVSERLMQQIRNGAKFNALAREFSQSASAAVGGDLGWVTKGQLDPTLDRTLDGMSKGQIAGPTRTLAGYHILLLIDRVVPSAGSGGDVVVDYTQLILPLAPDATGDTVAKEQEVAQQIRSGVQSCEDMRAAAASIKTPKSGDVKDVHLKDLPSAIRNSISKLEVGQTTAPIRIGEGLFLATLCARTGGKNDALPTAEDIRRRLGNSRFDLLIQRYMRDLRQTAFVDIRG